MVYHYQVPRSKRRQELRTLSYVATSCSPSSTSQPAALLTADPTVSTTPPVLANVNSMSANDTPNFPSPTASRADDSSAEMDFTASPENNHNTPTPESARTTVGTSRKPSSTARPRTELISVGSQLPPDTLTPKLRLYDLLAAIISAAHLSSKTSAEITLQAKPAQSHVFLKTPSPHTAHLLLSLTHLQLNGKPISVKTYAPNPPISFLGVIHNVGRHFTPAQLMHDLESFTTDILAARMMGTTESVLITFAGTVIPHFVYFKRVAFRCRPHKPKPPTCTRCLALGTVPTNALNTAFRPSAAVVLLLCPRILPLTYAPNPALRRATQATPSSASSSTHYESPAPPTPSPPGSGAAKVKGSSASASLSSATIPSLSLVDESRSFDLRLIMLERHQREQQRTSHELQQKIHTLTQTLETTTSSLRSQLTKLNEHISTLITPSSNAQETRTARTVPGYRAYHATTGTPLASVYVRNDVLFLHSLPSTTHLLLGGDFNAPHTLWGYPQTLKPGRLLHCLAQERHLTLNNPGSPTRAGTVSQRSTTPDLTFSRGTLSFHWQRCRPVAVAFAHVTRSQTRIPTFSVYGVAPQNAQLSSRISALRTEIVAHGASLEHARWSTLCEGLDSALHSRSTWSLFKSLLGTKPALAPTLAKALTQGTPSEVFDNLTSLYLPPPLTTSYPAYSAKNAHALHHALTTCHSVTHLLRRVVTRRSGLHEAHVCRVAHALALNKFLYFVPYVSFTNIQLNTLETALLGLYKATLNLPITTSTAKLFATGLFHPPSCPAFPYPSGSVVTGPGGYIPHSRFHIYLSYIHPGSQPSYPPPPVQYVSRLACRPSSRGSAAPCSCGYAIYHPHLPAPETHTSGPFLHPPDALSLESTQYTPIPKPPSTTYRTAHYPIHSNRRSNERSLHCSLPPFSFAGSLGIQGVTAMSWPISSPPSEDGGRLSLRRTIKEVYLQLRLDKRLYPPPHPSLTVPEARLLRHVQINALVTPSRLFLYRYRVDPSCPNCPSTYADLAHCLFHCPAAHTSPNRNETANAAARGLTRRVVAPASLFLAEGVATDDEDDEEEA
ncbi:hypothetical protein HPB49_012880 [Dermacentor silvarum]|uniref:Uncharacterized protein n=1 Tax=Dermacentor silvarum TaxID=543639 RepID=A0ACB8C9G6_DERSI|nr:hypothetical protein HPB49_012880 [Dermacentor silvarum]